MDREEEEALQHITARYVSELHAGYHPLLSDYLSRYPQYAVAITDVVTYIHAAEVNLPEEMHLIAPLSQASRIALDEAWQRVLHSERVTKNALTSLKKAAHNVGKSISQLAQELDLGLDILNKLEHHLIDSMTIPQEVCIRLAKALQKPRAAVEIYLGLGEHKLQTRGIAEAQASYHVEERSRSNIQTQSFREAIEQSIYLTNEQKEIWYNILSKKDI